MNLDEFLILEKRIAQISSKVEVTFSFDIIKTNHAEKRSDFEKRGLGVDTIGYVSNREMADFVLSFRREISEALALGDIKDGQNFIIRSIRRQLLMVVIANHQGGAYWKLIIKTLWRETNSNKFRIGADQLVFDK